MELTGFVRHSTESGTATMIRFQKQRRQETVAVNVASANHPRQALSHLVFHRLSGAVYGSCWTEVLYTGRQLDIRFRLTQMQTAGNYTSGLHYADGVCGERVVAIVNDAVR